jgi:hypothetical protein
MGHKDLLVTHTLYRQRDYSEVHDAASAAPAFQSASVQLTLICPQKPNCRQQADPLIEQGFEPASDVSIAKRAPAVTDQSLERSRLRGTNPNCELLSPDLSTTVSGEAERLRGVTSSRSNIILGEHLSGALIQLLRATYFFKARQQIVRS